MPRLLCPILLLLVGCALTVQAAGPPTLESRFEQTVKPFLAKHCTSCHGLYKQESKLNLSTYSSVKSIINAYTAWQDILERVEAEEMPPAKARTQPSDDERAAVIAWIKELFDREATRNVGDPGTVLARRLSNPEYDNTIRDLTGIDLRPTREFPVDPANEAGFANSGESLTMSPALLKKYLEAARKVADHAVLKPNGAIDFAPHLAVTDTDRDKYCVQRIINFYNSHNVEFSTYFLTLLESENADGSLSTNKLADIAKARGLSARYLDTLGNLLYNPGSHLGPLDDLRTRWKSRPKFARDDASVKSWCDSLQRELVAQRKSLTPTIANLNVKGMSKGSQPLVIWRNEQLATSHQLPPDENKLDELLKKLPDGTSRDALKHLSLIHI